MIDLGINLFQEIAALGGGGGGGYSISNSLRFNDDDSAYLSRTPASAGDRKTFTFSTWVKRGNLTGARQGVFISSSAAGTDYWAMEFESNDKLNVYDSAIGGSTVIFTTTSVFRDVSGWYHIVVAIDTTQATSSDRAKLYINGVQISAFDAVNYPPLNNDTRINSTVQHSVGSWEPLSGAGFYLDGYMADVNFIDGQALTADDFGEINATTGEWSPKKYSGTYGTNGFYLEFKDSAALGDDTSGNTNDWTPTNLASTDQMLDTPTNNFSVLQNSPLGSGVTYQEGNLEFNNATFNTAQSGSTIRFASGKWYCEVVGTLGVDLGWYGVRNPVSGNYWIYYANSGFKYSYISGTLTGSAYGSTYTIGDVIGIAYDADTGDLQFYKNNVAQGVIATGFAGQELDFYFADGASDAAHNGVLNFGADSSFAGSKTRQGNTDANGIGDFYYTPPTGYLALCADNLPEPTIVDSESQFNVVTYTGDGNTGRAVTGVGFQPDFVWLKRRDGADGHIINDSVRGVAKNLFPFSGIPENTTAYLSSFDTDGFTLDIVANGTNASGGTYVAWCMKAGGTAVTNNDGSITSQVSANVDAGFSIVNYTGSGSTDTVGHGLSATPELIIVKKRASVNDWSVYTATTGASNKLVLNSTSASTSTGAWASTSPTSTVFTAGTTFSGAETIAYCFHSVDGFSKFGSYVGNGSTNGPFVYTGFKPAFVLYKRATGGTGNWILYDNKREGYNGDNPALYPNLTLEESISGASIDLLSNGFKILNPNTDHNASGSTYIYMAFAEAPFKNAVAR